MQYIAQELQPSTAKTHCFGSNRKQYAFMSKQFTNDQQIIISEWDASGYKLVCPPIMAFPFLVLGGGLQRMRSLRPYGLVILPAQFSGDSTKRGPD